MTIPLFCVFVAFLLTMASKGPVALAMARQPGGYDNKTPREQQASLQGWGRRAVAAHLNSFEAFPAFAAAVLVASIAAGDPVWTARLSVVFVIARALYVPLYVFDFDRMRSLVWTVGFGSTVGIFLLPLLS
jgi:uncharacterized MAPEG superfamily protein